MRRALLAVALLASGPAWADNGASCDASGCIVGETPQQQGVGPTATTDLPSLSKAISEATFCPCADGKPPGIYINSRPYCTNKSGVLYKVPDDKIICPSTTVYRDGNFGALMSRPPGKQCLVSGEINKGWQNCADVK